MFQKKLGLLVFILLFLLPGCQIRDISHTAAVLSIGIDEENEQIKISAQVAKPSAPEESGSSSSEPQFIVISETGKSMVEAARKMSLTLPRIPLWTYTNTIIVSEDLAKKDISFLIDTIARNPNIRKNSFLIIARKTSPEEIMQAKSPLEPFPAQAIVNILQMQEKTLGIYTAVSLGDFIKKASTMGIEPVVPQFTIINKKGKGLLSLEGSAVFLGTKMVGSFTEEESQGYRFLLPGLKRGGIINVPSPLNPQNLMVIELLNIQTKAKAEIKDGKILIKLTIDSEGNFYEQNSTENLLNIKQVDNIEKATAEELKRKMQKSIKKAKDLKCDVFGWGKLVENSSPSFWKEIKKDWLEIFPSVKSEIKVSFKLRRTYLTDKSFVFRK
ncbi:Ger(x)C family spore germination protein [Thermosyntropha sp.]|uniref:Ger(x)C family spore germination protein n=1 Tax=Thermosyntropha sp. TaxID=2740820 RepID=UPI0025E4F78C|nr:Ger(x)C family spore germination protein [Thermosyntropha sp.]MBO8159773.1 Ger(x)C family spore germination protein [Thermosyntropha sp.]